MILFSIISVIISLYFLYILSFKLFWKDRYFSKKPQRVLFPRILYIVFTVIALTPILNIIGVIFFGVFLMVDDEFFIDTWLFKTPQDKSGVDD